MIKYDNRGHKIVEAGGEDPRYTIRIFLMRDQRPKYWNFFCIYCGNKVCEINGAVMYMTDISAEGLSTDVKSAARVRCNSVNCRGRAWFAFDF